MNKKVLYAIIAAVVVIALVVVIAVVAGNGKKGDEETTDITDTNNTPEVVETVDNDEQQTISDVTDLEFYSDDKQIVFMQADNIYWVFGYEGNKITSYTIYVKCDDATQAATAALAYDRSDEDIKSVTTEGRYVKVETNPSAYEDMSPDDLRQTFSYLKEHTK